MQKIRFWRGPITTFQNLKAANKRDGEKFLMKSFNDRTCDKGFNKVVLD